MWQKAFIGMAICAALVSGCLQQGRDFSATPVADIQQNVTTQREIFNHFGEPVRRGIENGFETWTYYYNYWELAQLKDSKELTVVFNKDNTVRSYSFSTK